MQHEASRVPNSDLSTWRHEVRNKLNIIRGYTSLLEMDDLTREQKEGVKEIAAASRQIERLLEELPEIASSPVGDPGSGCFSPRPTDGP